MATSYCEEGPGQHHSCEGDHEHRCIDDLHHHLQGASEPGFVSMAAEQLPYVYDVMPHQVFGTEGVRDIDT